MAKVKAEDLAMCKLGVHKPDQTSYRCSRCGVSMLDLANSPFIGGFTTTTASGTAGGTSLTLKDVEKAIGTLTKATAPNYVVASPKQYQALQKALSLKVKPQKTVAKFKGISFMTSEHIPCNSVGICYNYNEG